MEVEGHIHCTQPSDITFLSADGGCTFSVRWAKSTGYTDSSQIESLAAAAWLTIIHEDKDLVVVDKPAFLPCENTVRLKDSVRSRIEAYLAGGNSLIAAELGVRISDPRSSAGDSSSATRGSTDEIRLDQGRAGEVRSDSRANLRLHMPHRLDWETSGVLVLAKTKHAMASLSRQFAERVTSKVYTADVLGAPPAHDGSICLPLSPDPMRQPRQRIDFSASGKGATTRWSVLRGAVTTEQGQVTRLRLEPHTGRRHQLRVHLAAIGCAIAGDTLYAHPTTQPPAEAGCEPHLMSPNTRGSDELSDAPVVHPAGEGARLHLHASELSFHHPATEVWVTFRSTPTFALEDVLRQS